MRLWLWCLILLKVAAVMVLSGAIVAYANVPAADQHMARGQDAFDQGDFETAAQHWHQAARMYGQGEQAAAHRHANLRLAQAYEALGHYDRAVQTLETIRPLAKRANDRKQLAAILASLGNLYMVTGPWDRAADHLKEALQAAVALSDSKLSASILNDLGNLFVTRPVPQANDFAQAVRFYQQSAEAARRVDHDAMAGRALTHAAMAMLKAYGSDQALLDPPLTVKSWLDQARVHLLNTAPSHAQLYDLINAGLAYRELGRYMPEAEGDLRRQSAQVLQRAAQGAEQLRDTQAASYAWGHLGYLYEEEKRYHEALQLTRRAVFAAQQQPAPESLYQWQWQKGRLLRALNKQDLAIAAYTQAVDTVQAMRDALPCSYGKDPSSFRETLGPIYFELADLLLKRAAAAPDTPEADDDLQRARHTVELFKAVELRDYWRDECVGALQSPSVSLEVVSRTAVVIYPIALPDRLELLVGLPSGLKRFAVPVPAEKLERVSRGFRRFVQQGRPAYKRLARPLYDWLIRPLEADLATLAIRTLVFVPDGVLRTVPLAALHDGQQFLIHKYALAMTPGLQLTDPKPLPRSSLHILTAGSSQAPGPGFSALPHVEQELKALEQLLPGRVRRLPQLGIAELEAAIRDQPFSLMHIASHARFAPDAENSFLLASDGQKLTMTHLQEVMSRARFRDQPLALLTLSACETALGDDRAALGLAGVAVRAGVRSALATLWRVEDASTAKLMETFYHHLLETGMSRAQALQRAQLTLMADGRYHHPYYWAPFLLINSWL